MRKAWFMGSFALQVYRPEGWSNCWRNNPLPCLFSQENWPCTRTLSCYCWSHSRTCRLQWAMAWEQDLKMPGQLLAWLLLLSSRLRWSQQNANFASRYNCQSFADSSALLFIWLAGNFLCLRILLRISFASSANKVAQCQHFGNPQISARCLDGSSSGLEWAKILQNERLLMIWPAGVLGDGYC